MITYYYPKTIKGVTTALLSMFNDMKVYKYDVSGAIVDEYPVFISFGPMEKAFQGRTENFEYIASGSDVNGYKQSETVGQRYQISTPRMALVLNGIAYNAERAYSVNSWREWFAQSLELSGTNIDDILTDYQPTPYDMNFTLFMKMDSIDYLSQILENILPYFNPALYLRVKEFSFLNIERDLKVTMTGVVPEFVSNEISETDKRYVNATIDLTVESWQYRPFEYGKIIKFINSKYIVNTQSPLYDTLGSVSAESFNTSAVMFTSAGELPTSGVPLSGTYDFSGIYEDSQKEFQYFTSAIRI